MLNRTKSGAEKKTRKKVAGVRGMCSSSEDESVYCKNRIHMRGNKLSHAPPTVSMKTSSSLEKEYKCLKAVETLYKETSKTSLQQLKERHKCEDLPKMNYYTKNLKTFLAPGEMSLFNKRPRQSGDGPVYADNDFPDTLKNFPQTIYAKNSKCLSVNSSQAYSDAMLSYQRKLGKNYPDISAGKCIPKNGRTKSVCKSDIKCPKSQRDTDSRQCRNSCFPYGGEVPTFIKFGDKTAERETLSSSHSDESCKSFKLNELEKLDEEELRELYDYETSVNESRGSSNSSSNPQSLNERKYSGKTLNSKLGVKYNLNYKRKNFEFKSENERQQSSRDRDLVNSKFIGEKQLLGEESSQVETSKSKIFDRKQQEMEAIVFDSFAWKKLEPGVMNWSHSGQKMAKLEAKTFRKFDRKEIESKITGCHYLNQKRTEHEKSLKQSDSHIIKMGKSGSKHLYLKRLEPEVINFTDDNQKQLEPNVNSKHGDWNCLEPEMMRSKNLTQKLPASKIASCKPMVSDSLPLDTKSSTHFCQMLAKSLPNGKIIPFDKLSEILPEAELTKLNEKINKNIEEKQLLPSLFEDTQSHVDRIKEQILQKAKDCLPQATFSKINQFLSSNKSESEPETVRSTPFLIPETKTCTQVIASSGRQRSNQSSVSCHEGDGIIARSTHHIRDVPLKCGRKLSSSNSYYDHLYSVYGSKRRGCRSRKYRSENLLGTQTLGKNQKTLQKSPESSKSDRKKSLSCGASNEDFLKVRYSNKYKCKYIFDSDNFKRPISSCESADGHSERSVHDGSVDSKETNLLFVEYNDEYLPLDHGAHSDCVTEMYFENFNGFTTLNFQTVQQQNDADPNCYPLKPCLNSDFAVTACSCPLNSFESSLEQPDLSPDSQQNISNNSDSCCELFLQQTFPEGCDLSLGEPYNQSFKPSTKMCDCPVVYEAGDCSYEMSRFSCNHFDPFLKKSTLTLDSSNINFDKCPCKSFTTNALFYDFNNLIHETDLFNSWKHSQGPDCFEKENFELCNEKFNAFESYQNCLHPPSSCNCSSMQREGNDCKRKYETFNFNAFGDSCVESTYRKYHPSESRQNQSLGDFDGSEFWHGLYEPTEADDILISQYYLYLTSKFLGSEVLQSRIEKFFTKNFDFNHSDTNIRSNKMVPEVPKSEILNNPKINKEYNQSYLIHSHANCVEERSNRSRPKSEYNNSVPSIDLGNGMSRTNKFRISHLYSNWNCKKRGFGFGFKEKSLISKTHKKHSHKFRSWLNYAAHKFLKSGVNLRLKVRFNKSAISQFERAAQGQRTKLRVKLSNHSNILIPVPGITPVSMPSASHVSNPSNSIEKVTCHQAETSSGFAIKPAHKIFSETLSNLNICPSPQPMQRIKRFISLSQNANRYPDCDKTKTGLEFCGHQYFESNVPALQNCDITLECEQTSNFSVSAFLESPPLQNFETSETHASSHSFYNSNLKIFPNSVLNSCSEPNPPHVPDGYESNLFMECFLEAKNFVKIWNSFQLQILFTPSCVLTYPKMPSFQDLELGSICSVRCHHHKSAQILQSLKTSIRKLRKILEPNADLQNFQLNSKVRVFQEEKLERTPKSGRQAKSDYVCLDVPVLCLSRQILELHSQNFFDLKQGLNASTIRNFSPKNELPFFHSVVSVSKTIFSKSFESYDSWTCQKHLVHPSDLSPSKITRKCAKPSLISDNSRSNQFLQSSPPDPEAITNSFLPKRSDTLETACSSYFHLLSLLAQWYYKHHASNEIKNPTFPKTLNNGKVVRFVDHMTQTDLCLTNSKHFDSFLLAHILSLDDSAEHVNL